MRRWKQVTRSNRKW